jgi:hypothetical protein
MRLRVCRQRSQHSQHKKCHQKDSFFHFSFSAPLHWGSPFG